MTLHIKPFFGTMSGHNKHTFIHSSINFLRSAYHMLHIFKTTYICEGETQTELLTLMVLTVQ